jgi:Holliday junction resolvase RusA-like endonuclease
MMVSFTVPGRVPSKSNYRHSAKQMAQWQRIKSYEQEVGLSAICAGARSHLGSGPARVKVLLVNQRLDLDNALKCPIDGLKGVAFVDDSPEHLEAVQVCQAKDDGPVRAEYRISWEDE